MKSCLEWPRDGAEVVVSAGDEAERGGAGERAADNSKEQCCKTSLNSVAKIHRG